MFVGKVEPPTVKLCESLGGCPRVQVRSGVGALATVVIDGEMRRGDKSQDH